MAKYTVVKQRVFIVEADSDNEANNIVVHEIDGVPRQSDLGYYCAEYTKVFEYGSGDPIVSFAFESDQEKPEGRRVSGYDGP
jgi:hypothetical protein